MMSVKTSAIFIAKHSKSVRINEQEIKRTAEAILLRMTALKYSSVTWKVHPLNPKTADQNAIDWIFLVDLLNFSFWVERSDKAPYQVDGYKGYWSLCAAINRSLKEGIPVASPSWMANCTLQDFKHAFRPDDREHQEIPMLKERLELVNRAGVILQTKCQGSFINLIRQSNKSAVILMELVFDLFGDIFFDSCLYLEQAVQFQKRAQILVADIWACFEGQGIGEFIDIDEITMFADYRVPQTLLYFQCIKYSDALLKVLSEHEAHHNSATSNHSLNSSMMIHRGDAYEVEIRGCSIHAVELLVKYMREKLGVDKGINAILVDFYLWDLAQEKKQEMAGLPIHRIRSIYY
jgi:hypothetical protein